MSVLQALVLGLVQGATIIFPVSSSGHWTLIPYAAGWRTPPAGFGIAVNAGALAAICWVFRERLADLARAVRKPDEANRALLRLAGIGTIPALVVGVAFSSVLDRVFHRPVLTALMLGVSGWALLTAERFAKEHDDRVEQNAVARQAAELSGEAPPGPEAHKEEADLTNEDAAIIGVAQAFAIVPGITRTGFTMGAAMRQGVSRESALRFSFLLAIPFVLGSAVAKIPGAAKHGHFGGAMPFVVGLVTSVVAGVLALEALIRIVRARGLKPFATYCFFAMAAAILVALARG